MSWGCHNNKSDFSYSLYREGDPDFYKLLEYEQNKNNLQNISTADIPGLIGTMVTILSQLVDYFLEKYNFSYSREEAVGGLYQVYTEDSPSCYRGGGPTTNLAKNSSLWTMSIPHPQLSGLCYTYK